MFFDEFFYVKKIYTVCNVKKNKEFYSTLKLHNLIIIKEIQINIIVINNFIILLSYNKHHYFLQINTLYVKIVFPCGDSSLVCKKNNPRLFDLVFSPIDILSLSLHFPSM